MKKINKIWVFLLLITLASNAYGFAVSSPYWTENPMELSPGYTETVSLTMQNTLPEDDDMYVDVELKDGSSVARILGDETRYFVPHGSTDITVDVEVNIPEDMKIGDARAVTLSFKPDTKPTEGMLAIGLEIVKGFDVKIVAPKATDLQQREVPKSKGPGTAFIVGFVIVIIAIFIFMALSKKKSGKKKKKR